MTARPRGRCTITGDHMEAATLAEAVPMCQHCLADPRYTPVAVEAANRCPVCGAAYRGPRRSAAYQVLLDAGLVARGD